MIKFSPLNCDPSSMLWGTTLTYSMDGENEFRKIFFIFLGGENFNSNTILNLAGHTVKGGFLNWPIIGNVLAEKCYDNFYSMECHYMCHENGISIFFFNPTVRKMEAEVVQMCVNMYHGGKDACGTVRAIREIMQ